MYPMLWKLCVKPHGLDIQRWGETAPLANPAETTSWEVHRPVLATDDQLAVQDSLCAAAALPNSRETDRAIPNAANQLIGPGWFPCSRDTTEQPGCRPTGGPGWPPRSR